MVRTRLDDLSDRPNRRSSQVGGRACNTRLRHRPPEMEKSGERYCLLYAHRNDRRVCDPERATVSAAERPEPLATKERCIVGLSRPDQDRQQQPEKERVAISLPGLCRKRHY